MFTFAIAESLGTRLGCGCTQNLGMVERKNPEQIVGPLLSAVCEEYHRHNIKSHKYSHETCMAYWNERGAGDAESARGDMNYVSKVCLSMKCATSTFTVALVLKSAPVKVLVSS